MIKAAETVVSLLASADSIFSLVYTFSETCETFLAQRLRSCLRTRRTPIVTNCLYLATEPATSTPTDPLLDTHLSTLEQCGSFSLLNLERIDPILAILDISVACGNLRNARIASSLLAFPSAFRTTFSNHPSLDKDASSSSAISRDRESGSFLLHSHRVWAFHRHFGADSAAAGC